MVCAYCVRSKHEIISRYPKHPRQDEDLRQNVVNTALSTLATLAVIFNIIKYLQDCDVCRDT